MTTRLWIVALISLLGAFLIIVTENVIKGASIGPICWVVALIAYNFGKLDQKEGKL